MRRVPSTRAWLSHRAGPCRPFRQRPAVGCTWMLLLCLRLRLLELWSAAAAAAVACAPCGFMPGNRVDMASCTSGSSSLTGSLRTRRQSLALQNVHTVVHATHNLSTVQTDGARVHA